MKYTLYQSDAFFLLPITDVEDVDNEKREMTEVDVAGLHRFYSKHLEIPDHKDLLTLFSQVHTHTQKMTTYRLLLFLSRHLCLCLLFNRLPVMVSL